MNNTNEFNFFENLIDSARNGGQIEFYKRYRTLDDDIRNKLPYSYADLENAFQHAYAAACYTKKYGENITRWLGYQKEFFSKKTEIKNFGSKYYAYLDTNRDLWNNEMGINMHFPVKNRARK